MRDAVSNSACAMRLLLFVNRASSRSALVRLASTSAFFALSRPGQWSLPDSPLPTASGLCRIGQAGGSGAAARSLGPSAVPGAFAPPLQLCGNEGGLVEGMLDSFPDHGLNGPRSDTPDGMRHHETASVWPGAVVAGDTARVGVPSRDIPTYPHRNRLFTNRYSYLRLPRSAPGWYYASVRRMEGHFVKNRRHGHGDPRVWLNPAPGGFAVWIRLPWHALSLTIAARGAARKSPGVQRGLQATRGMLGRSAAGWGGAKSALNFLSAHCTRNDTLLRIHA